MFEILASLRGRQNDRLAPYWEKCVEEVRKLIADGCASGELNVSEPDQRAMTFYCALDASFIFSMHGMSRDVLEAAVRNIVELLINGLRGGSQKPS